MQYLYLIKCESFYKIGIANDVESRLTELSTGNPFDLEVLAVYGFDNAQLVEQAIHRMFYAFRKRGEWFALGDSEITTFRQICEGQIDLPAGGGKWDYAAMFADGWRMEKTGTGKYWQWRERKHSGKTIYGGSVASLPCSIEEMRIRYESERITS